MKNRHETAQALMWAAAIIAAALLKAPTALTLLLLPSLAVVALLATGHRGRIKGNEVTGTCN